MAGFWHLSHHQLRDLNGGVYAGARAFFYEAATLDPIITYQDYGLGTAHPPFVEANAYGVFPPVFFDEEDGFYRQRITSAGGVIIPGTDVGTLPIIGPGVGGGGAEVPVDANSLFQTGDLKARYGVGTHSGWVRANGRAIGSSTSGASERANADCQPLFEYLWGADSALSVSGGRGLTASADWSGNKTIALPDWRGYALAALDDMGNTAAGRLTASYFGAVATTLGAAGGSESHTLTLAQSAAHDHGGTVGDTASNLQLTGGPASPTAPTTNNTLVDGGSTRLLLTGQGGTTSLISLPHNHTIPSAGSGAAHNNVPPTKLATIYIRL